MIIRYIPLPDSKSSGVEKLLDTYIQNNFLEKENLLFNNKIVSFKKKDKGILLYCIRPIIDEGKLQASYKNNKVIPIQEHIFNKVIKKHFKEEKIMVLYFTSEGKGILEVIYKKQLIHTRNINDRDLERLDEIIYDCSKQIINICSIKEEDWTLIFINKGIDEVKSRYKNIKEMSLVRST
ncbi:hypothetical protein ACPWSR_17175 [Alloiococcus sp. CFN-8]|uniref:hypothetical protein n=1 Tax=Alloiococcus sp. CFN-8 TaxID=3416081 RepID=UPI003CE9E5EF